MSSPRAERGAKEDDGRQRDQPLVSFILVTYQQAKFVREALESALAQDYPSLQIVVSDDHSQDDTFDVIVEVLAAYSGPHEVQAVRNDVNLGLIGNINAAMGLAKGDFVVIGAGDDIALPERTRKLFDVFLRSNKQAKSIYSNALVLNELGQFEGTYYPPGLPAVIELGDLAGRDGGVLGCAQAWSRDIFEIFGAIDPLVTREDAVIPFRAALLGHVAYVDLPLVQYRRHATNFHFREARQIRGRPELYRALRAHSAGNVAVIKARLADIRTIRSSGVEPPDLSEVERLSHRLLIEKTLEHELVSSGTRLLQLRLIFSGIKVRVPLRRIARWTLVAYSPQAYLWHQSWQLSRSRALKRKRRE